MTATPANRERYIDALRALALSRVIVYHLVGAAWLSYALPAIGVMFALAGSLMARSVDRSASRAVTSRVRRLLPAVWVLGAVLLPIMLWHGWSDHPRWSHLLLWAVPLIRPPGSDWTVAGTETLWYVVTYLWLVLLSPPVRWLYRRHPVRTAMLPLGALVLLEFLPQLARDSVQSALVDVATFGACWVVGFAHRDGKLRRIPLPRLIALAVACLGIGVAWALTHRADGLDLNDIPVAQGFYSLGFVLLVMRATPSMAWLARLRVLDRLVALLNARAVTVYLWHNLAIAVCFVVGDWLQVWRLGDSVLAQAGYLVVAVLLLVVPLVLVGWVEDVAARRPPRLLPWGPPRARPAHAPRQRTAPAAQPAVAGGPPASAEADRSLGEADRR
jgi:peptidoglycan/LPS O-acetylase OafA/YrhL